MRRREFLAYGSASALLATYASQQGANAFTVLSGNVTIDIGIDEVYEEMIDGEVLWALAFRDLQTGLSRSAIRVREGSTVKVNISNGTRASRRFTIPGIAGSTSAVIKAGKTASVTFLAPTAGSYMYVDNANGVVNRVLGLHGPFIVVPADGRTAGGCETPYSAAALTPAISSVFDALGVHHRFGGEKWRPDLASRERIWMFNTIDPKFNQMGEMNQAIAPATFKSTNRPRYFTLNGLSGFDSSHNEETVPSGYIGEPCLIRMMNAGMAWHAPHIHGNHLFQLGGSEYLQDAFVVNSNCPEFDVVELAPGVRKDVLLPFEIPTEIPAQCWPPKQETFPLRYPMHCHMEISQTAAGGNYPQGLITDWEILGPRRAGV